MLMRPRRANTRSQNSAFPFLTYLHPGHQGPVRRALRSCHILIKTHQKNRQPKQLYHTKVIIQFGLRKPLYARTVIYQEKGKEKVSVDPILLRRTVPIHRFSQYTKQKQSRKPCTRTPRHHPAQPHSPNPILNLKVQTNPQASSSPSP